MSRLETNSEATMSGPQWRLLGLLMAICFLGHFNRVSMPVAGDLRIMEQYGLSPTDMGLIYSAFLAAYTLVMIPGGWLIDRRGPRLGMQLVCFGSAAFVALTGCVGLLKEAPWQAWVALFGVRACMGVVSAPLHPSAANAVSREIPLAHRSAANGLTTGAALLGIAATFPVFGWLIDQLDWPGAFLTMGLITAACGLLWTYWQRGPPGIATS